MKCGSWNVHEMPFQGSGNLDAIQIIKKLGGALEDSYLDEGFLLDKKIGVNQPKRIEKAQILIANTPMDTDKIKVIWKVNMLIDYIFNMQFCFLFVS